MYCLLNDSPDLFAEEQEQIDHNQTEVVNRGRAVDAKIIEGETIVSLHDWAQRHLKCDSRLRYFVRSNGWFTVIF